MKQDGNHLNFVQNMPTGEIDEVEWWLLDSHGHVFARGYVNDDEPNEVELCRYRMAIELHTMIDTTGKRIVRRS